MKSKGKFAFKLPSHLSFYLLLATCHLALPTLWSCDCATATRCVCAPLPSYAFKCIPNKSCHRDRKRESEKEGNSICAHISRKNQIRMIRGAGLASKSAIFAIRLHKNYWFISYSACIGFIRSTHSI